MRHSAPCTCRNEALNLTIMDAMAETSVAPRGRLRDALAVWTRVSIAGIGGAAPQITTLHRLLVPGRRSIFQGRFFHALHYSLARPAPGRRELALSVGGG